MIVGAARLLVVVAMLAVAYRAASGGDTAPSGAEAAAPRARSAAAPLGVLIAGGSLYAGAGDGIFAADLASQQELGRFVSGGPTQGFALARSPDAGRAYLLDWVWDVGQQRAERQLLELELPALKVLRRAPLADAINLLGRARVIAVASDGGEVYVETMRITGPQRFDPQLRVGQPESDYGIATFDVAQGAFTRTMRMDPPWCGVGQMFVAAGGRLAILCTTAHQVRLIDPTAGLEVGRVSVSGDMAEASADGSRMWVLSRSGEILEVELGHLSVGRRVKLAGSEKCSFCLPLQVPHVTADGKLLFVRASPNDAELPPSGRGTDVWVIDTATLTRTLSVALPGAAFDAAPTPDGAFVVASSMRTEPPTGNAAWLIEVATGREVKRWPWALCCLEIWPAPQTT